MSAPLTFHSDSDAEQNQMMATAVTVAASPFGGSETCWLEEDDAQCGHIFFSASTRLLKFYCTFCRETYDNINYFCEHLGEHVNEATAASELVAVVDANEPAFKLEQTEARSEHFEVNAADIIAPEQLILYKAANEEVEVAAEEYASILDENFVNFHGDDEMIVEELDEEAAEIAAEVAAEMRQAAELEIKGTTFVKQELEHSCSSANANANTHEFPNFAADEAAEEPGAELAECNATPMKIATELTQHYPADVYVARRPFKKKKRVTTVKVIAVKNRVAELYQRIKLEEEKRLSGEFDNVNNDGDSSVATKDEQNQTVVETETTNENDKEVAATTASAIQPAPQPEVPVMRKIIGETVITLLSDGDAVGSCSTTSLTAATPPTPPPAATVALPPTTSSNSSGEKDCCICPACGKRFRSSFSLTIHKRTHYLESDSSIKLAHKCADCDRLFNRISELKNHVEAVHYPQGFVCPVCQRQLSSLTLLETHMRRVHLARPFNCKLCSKSFETRDALEAHANVHIAGDDAAANDLLAIRCRICGRKYATDAALQHHMRNHKAQEPQCCVVCGKMTLRITQHMKIHTPRPNRILSCSVCGKVFNFSSGLSQHIKVMHKFPRATRLPPQTDGTSLKRKRKPRPPRPKKKPISTKPAEEVLTEEAVFQEEHQLQDVNEKEEEAKRVIVEFIQSVTYNSIADVDDAGGALSGANTHYAHLLETALPIAREETISAVNSIVDDC